MLTIYYVKNCIKSFMGRVEGCVKIVELLVFQALYARNETM